MSGWPAAPGLYGKDILSTWGVESVGPIVGWANQGAPISAAWSGANEASYIPIIVDAPMRIKQFFACNGATAAGNTQLGIYTASGKLVGSCASTAQAGVNVPQFFAPSAETSLLPGLYYLALWSSSVTATFFRVAPGAQYVRMTGGVKQAGLTGGLPANWTPVISTSSIYAYGASVGRML